jgi:hypothetical protein
MSLSSAVMEMREHLCCSNMERKLIYVKPASTVFGLSAAPMQYFQLMERFQFYFPVGPAFYLYKKFKGTMYPYIVRFSMLAVCFSLDTRL